KRLFVLQILNGLAARHLIKWWLGDIEVTALNEFRHLAEEECQQERTNMRTVDIRIRHDDDFMITQLLRIKFILADGCAKRSDQRANFLASQHLIETRALNVQNLTT